MLAGLYARFPQALRVRPALPARQTPAAASVLSCTRFATSGRRRDDMESPDDRGASDRPSGWVNRRRQQRARGLDVSPSGQAETASPAASSSEGRSSVSSPMGTRVAADAPESSDASPAVDRSGSAGVNSALGSNQQKSEEERFMANVDRHMDKLRARSERVVEDDPSEKSGKFVLDWRKSPGHGVPYRFRIEDPVPRPKAGSKEEAGNAPTSQPAPYTDFTGLRFPTLETAENFDYHQDQGLDKLVERSFPIKVPGYRRLDPYLREYIHFLHNLDPARFTVSRIAERYRLREKTVATVVKEWAVGRWLTRSGLTRLRHKQVTREAVILAKKEQEYKKWVGWDQLGDEDDPETDDEALGEYKGWRSTSDWVRRQSVEVEMMSAFPMMEKRDPMPKRVDVDLTVGNNRKHKIINWIDPTDKVVF